MSLMLSNPTVGGCMRREAPVAERASRRSALAAAFRRDVLEGLSQRPRAIPARWLYDRLGSELFNSITMLPEYSPAAAERSILRQAAGEIGTLTGYGRAIIEFGSGSATKTPILLSALKASSYVPIDISDDFLEIQRPV